MHAWMVVRRAVVAATLAMAVALGATALANGATLGAGGAAQALAAACGTDEFDGTALDDARWDVLRPDGSLSVSGGKLNLTLSNTDLIGGSASAANLVLQDAPAGGWTATTKFNIAAINGNGEQAGLALWKSENPNTFAKVTFIQTNSGTRQFEAMWTENGGTAIPIANSGTGAVTVASDADVDLRMRSDGITVTAEYSLDGGTTWIQIGRSARYSGPLRVGLLALRGSTADATQTMPFERFTLTCGPELSAAASTTRGVAPLAVNFDGSGAAGADNVGWSFGDGASATGEDAAHTFTEPGTYRATLSADANGNTSRATTTVTVLASDPPCPATNDDFSGNALDTKWEILRPRLTGLDVAGGQVRLLPYGGDMHGTTASVRNVLLQLAPAGPWKATAKLDTTGTTTNDQAGIIVWRGEAPNNFAKIVYNRRSATQYWVERQNNINGVTQAGGGNAGTITGVPNDLHIRASSDGAANPNITAEYSTDGTTWTPVVDAFQVGGSGPLKVGIAYWGPSGLRTGAFDFFHVEGPTACGDPDTIAPVTTATVNPPEPPGGIYDGPVTVTLSASDDAAGSGVQTTEYSLDGGAVQPYTTPFTVSGNGTHTVEYHSRDRAANTEASKSLQFQIGEPEPVNIFDTIGITEEANKANGQILGDPPYSLPAEEMPPSRSIVQGGPNDTQDDVWFRMPNTSGTVPNLARFVGQTVVLRTSEQKAYSKIHFFGTTTDGGPAGGDFTLKYSDGSTSTAHVEFRDWCNAGDATPEHHIAIGPSTHRWTATGEDGAPCSIYHVPGTADQSKTLVSVKLPPTTSPGTPPEPQAYLMALTLEEPNGTFVTPDLGASPFPDDLTAPTATATLAPGTPQGQNGWYTSNVTVSLAGADEQGGSGLDKVEYNVDGGAFQEYTAPFTISDDGGHVVQYRARDRAGNTATPKSIDVKIDRAAPTTSARLTPAHPGASGWYDDAVTLTLRGSDGATGSGIGATQYRIGNGAWLPYSGPVVLDEVGTYSITYRSTDVAGNGETAGAPTVVKVDNHAPATHAQLDASGANGVFRGPVRVTLAADDGPGSGAAATEYSLDGGGFQPYTGPFTVSAAGGHLLEFSSIDRAGNRENTQDVTFAISTQAGGDEPDPFVGLRGLPNRLSVGSLLRRGLRVSASCVSVGRGTLSLSVSRPVARRLGLKRTTLASRSVRCGDDLTLIVRLKPKGKAAKALKRARGSLTATVRLRMSGGQGSDADSERLVLRGKRRGG